MSIINDAINWVKSMIIKAIDMLPDSPFQITIPDYVHDIIGYVNYFIPIGQFITILKAWTACIIVWYVVMLLLRWIKAIE